MKLSIAVTILLLLPKKNLLLNILAIIPHQGKSHYMVFSVYLEELANRGHNVTIISYFSAKKPLDNYKDIILHGKSDMEESFQAIEIPFYVVAYYMISLGIETCEVMLANKEVQSLINSKQKFDVVVVEQFNSDCALGVAYKTGAPVVGITSHVLVPYHYQRFGLSDNPSYVSFHFSRGGAEPLFIQRLERVLYSFYTNCVYYYSQWMNRRTLEKYFNDIPPFEELGREIKFLLMYTNFILTGSKILPANVIEVGGYHVKEAKNLTGDLQKFVDNAEDGVVYISFGSVVNSATLPSEKQQTILDVIKEFPQRFIWKRKNDGLDIMKNKLYVSSWLPQSDILGHPKTLAFISHAGMGGTTEALHFGVPMVAIPFFGDQLTNAAAIEESGFGVHLPYKDLTKETLVAALKKVLNPEFRKRAQEVSSAWHDRPMSPLDTAVFWTEFAAKHPNLTFRTAAADVPMYQYLFLDVIAIILILGIFSYVLKTIISKTCSRKVNGSKLYENNKKSKQQ